MGFLNSFQRYHPLIGLKFKVLLPLNHDDLPQTPFDLNGCLEMVYWLTLSISYRSLTTTPICLLISPAFIEWAEFRNLCMLERKFYGRNF
ncbi:hypothetical protein BpJC7_24380 [Weizmannia acidilactici]|uniref:Uncharacterized protein n=1 Tax=Weizmannia acidilactici TaxID=2607726 RepID=A0A5J4JKC0_9BACI|nr:hypothetical protein BpJC4_02740 [Weizmannia acidilactici]GER71135.1 hypothetical protein BpJC7_24380 [Weizmannia acidilactici]GER75114.1 hypothetical protein BpPP18_31810 [Weizmannia acidilactici]